MAEFDLGSLPQDGTPIHRRERADNRDPRDTYSFMLENPGNINVALIGMSANADFELYYDVNNNLRIDSGDTLLDESSREGRADESSNLGNQPAGNYLIEVSQDSRGQNTSYELKISNSNPSNLLPIGEEFGNLNRVRTLNGSVGDNDTADVIHFTLQRASDFSLLLTGLSNDADVRLIQDRDRDRVIDPDEVRAGSFAAGNSDDSFAISLGAGDYFVQVYQYSGETDYTLSMAPDLRFAQSSDSSMMSLPVAK